MPSASRPHLSFSLQGLCNLRKGDQVEVAARSLGEIAPWCSVMTGSLVREAWPAATSLHIYRIHTLEVP